MRKVSAALLLLLFSAGISKYSLAQGTTPSGAPTQQELGQKAIGFITNQFGIDPTNLIPQTHQPLTAAGNWSIAKELPAACASIQFPCVLLSYRQPGTNILCQWTVLVKANHDDGFLLDLNEEAARYFSKRTYENNLPKIGYREITGGTLISMTKPLYPDLAKRNHLEGTVKLLARIDETGHVSEIKVISGSVLLLGSSIEAVKQWVYEPLKIDSVSISIRTLINVNYSFVPL